MADAPAIELREVVAADLPEHFAQQADAESASLAAVAPRDQAAFDAHWHRILADPSVVVRTIVADGTVVGSALSFTSGGRRLVGYWIARDRWGGGIASAALGQLLCDHVPQRPLFAEVATHNPASRKVLEKHGFEVIGEDRRDDVAVWVLRLD
jgi:RimJ/RimL family protein N-acetyltransferase